MIVHLKQVHLEQVHLKQVHLEQVHLEQVRQGLVLKLKLRNRLKMVLSKVLITILVCSHPTVLQEETGGTTRWN